MQKNSGCLIWRHIQPTVTATAGELERLREIAIDLSLSQETPGRIRQKRRFRDNLPTTSLIFRDS